jgi:hypothetical protein
MTALSSRTVLSTIVLSSALCVWSNPSASQVRSESTQQAKVAWLKQCISATDHRVAGEGESNFKAALAGLAGDLLGAGVSALGDAIERASREHAFSAEGLTRFNYYRIDLNTPSGVALKPAFGAAEGCLALSLEIPDAKVGLDDGNETARENVGLDRRPQLYVEARLIPLREGVYVQPAYVAYLAPIPGAPDKSTSIELHYSFSTPAAGTENGGRGVVFALAQIKLPRLRPGVGTKLGAEQLMSFGSAALAHRGREAIEAQRNSIAQVFDAVPAAIASVDAAKRALARAERRLQNLPADVDAKARRDAEDAVVLARDLLEDGERELATAREEKEMLEESLSGPLTGGITTAAVRFSAIRDANKFGLAVATALRGRASEFGTALSTNLTAATESPPPTWTTEDTALVLAMSNAAAERALATAKVNGDADEIFQKELELRNSKAQANQAAAAAKKPLPFPGL